MSSSFSFKGKVIAITGAASGIGLATSKMLAARGATLAMSDLQEGLLSSEVEGIKSSTGATVVGTVLNVTDLTAVTNWINSSISTHGKLDGAVNLAGVIGPSLGIANIEDLPESEWDFVIGVNLKGVYNCIRAELKAMKESLQNGKQEAASIVNAASVAGLIGMPKNCAYVASKHAVVGLTRAAAKECGSCGVRVNAIAPGAIHTPMTAGILEAGVLQNTSMGRMGKAEEVAELICWLLCDGSSYTTGTVQSIDGGWAC